MMAILVWPNELRKRLGRAASRLAIASVRRKTRKLLILQGVTVYF